MIKNAMCVICFIVTSIFVHGQVPFSTIQHKIFLGEFDSGKSIITSNLKKKSTSRKDKAQLHQLQGDMAKIAGDMETALENWNKAAKINSSIYAKKRDYHHAWKYAHLSNYHYEKINPVQAKEYADTCLQLISNLTIAQQKEIEVFKIWNILAQSYKLNANRNDISDHDKTYDYIQSLYRKSILFQIKHTESNYELAKTHHLLANSFFDKCHVYKSFKQTEKLKGAFHESLTNYDISLKLWTAEFGEIHYERAKTLFLKALIYQTFPNMEKEDFSKRYYKEALSAFGVDNNFKSISNVPNKEDLLMCFKYYTLELIAESKLQPDLLKKAKYINSLAISCWELMHQEQNGSKTNQNLAIYNLVPHEETIAIEMRFAKKVRNLNELFIANQKLKYFDLVKQNEQLKSGTIKLNQLQLKLKPNEVFLDFHVSHDNEMIYIFEIHPTQSKIIEIPFSKIPSFESFNESIANMDYDDFVISSTSLFKILFPSGIGSSTKFIISGDSFINIIPFEALLVSHKNVRLDDYRKLDYLINHVEVSYVFSAAFYNEKTSIISNPSLSAFAPGGSKMNLSQLPFSNNLVKELGGKYNANIFLDKDASLNHFNNCKSPIIQISGHGLISIESSEKSGLVFSDGLLKLSDVYEMKNAPVFLVLNNCNSGLGKFQFGDGIDGFVRAFHEAGTKTTLSNLWEVDDKASNQMLKQFYENLFDGKTSNEALRLSQLNQIKNAANSELAAPYYWAGNRLMGDDLRLKENSGSFRIYSLLIFGILIITLIIWINKLQTNN